MNAEQTVYRRVVRRDLHSSRAAPAILLAVLLILACAALGTVCVLLALRGPASAALLDTLRSWSASRYVRLGVGALAVILGLWWVLAGILPGRRPRRSIPSERAAVVVDDRAIANFLAVQAASAAGVAPGQVRVVIGRRRATARIVPTSGVRTDVSAVREALAPDSAGYGLTRAPRVLIARNGSVN